MEPLPKRNIDTGMGLERTAAVLQGVLSGFETDLLKPIIEYTAHLTGVDPADAVREYRVIADHLRAITFLINDGVLPSNEGRGYVERRILRRAVQRGRDLGMNEPFLYKVVGVIVDIYKAAYPELETKREHVSRVVKIEEERFIETLSQGLVLLDDIMDDLRKTSEKRISGPQLFRLYDTYGFPIELTEEIAGSKGFELDRGGFETEMEKQRERARAAFTGYETNEAQLLYTDLTQKLPATEFLGYDQLESDSEVLAIIKDGAIAESASSDSDVEVVLDRTPFYAEAGGQVGDKGVFEADGLKAEVTGAKPSGVGLTVHMIHIGEGELRVGQIVTARVNEDLRLGTAAHHSATHLLQSALREVIGDHVYQSGSLVTPERFRFDYAHFTAPERGQLRRVEALVNKHIRENIPLQTKILSFEEAKQMGAIALFGEKYGDDVRVVQMGDVSMELCGGTHVRASGDIGLCVITSESSVAAGIRRIEAVCGDAAYRRVREAEDIIEETGSTLNAGRREISPRIQQLLEERKSIEKELERLKGAAATDNSGEMLEQAVEVEGVKVLAARLDDHDTTHLRNITDTLKVKLKSGVVVIGGVSKGKVVLISGVTKDLIGKVHAGNLLKEIAKIVGGGGGGRPDMAQAGGKDPSKLSEALEEVPGAVERMIKSG